RPWPQPRTAARSRNAAGSAQWAGSRKAAGSTQRGGSAQHSEILRRRPRMLRRSASRTSIVHGRGWFSLEPAGGPRRTARNVQGWFNFEPCPGCPPHRTRGEWFNLEPSSPPAELQAPAPRRAALPLPALPLLHQPQDPPLRGRQRVAPQVLGRYPHAARSTAACEAPLSALLGRHPRSALRRALRPRNRDREHEDVVDLAPVTEHVHDTAHRPSSPHRPETGCRTARARRRVLHTLSLPRDLARKRPHA